MGIMVEIMAEIEVFCTCGEELEVTYQMKNDILTITTEPCCRCMENEREDGRQDGYDEGYDAGLEDAEGDEEEEE